MPMVKKWVCTFVGAIPSSIMRCPFEAIETPVGKEGHADALQAVVAHLDANHDHLMQHVIAWHDTIGEPVP